MVGPSHGAVEAGHPVPCPAAEQYVDGLLAVPATSRDTDERLTAIADLMVKEAHAWTGSGS